MDDEYYVDPGYWVDGYTVSYQDFPVPTWAVIPVTQILPSYLYQQYNDDPDVGAFFTSYNTTAQAYLDYLTNLNLPVWTSISITDSLLDWVASSLYGFNRPVLTFGGVTLTNGVYNSNVYDLLPYDSAVIHGTSSIVTVSDDIFKRCLTWNLYKGDGFQFNVRWLKKRVIRFLSGFNGVSPRIDNTYNVSVTYNSNKSIVIGVKSFYAPDIVQVLQAAITAQAVQLPFQYNFSVVSI